MQLKLIIEGHTDNQGGEKFNQFLSEKRANAVLLYLTGKGVIANRLPAKSYVQSKLIPPRL